MFASANQFFIIRAEIRNGGKTTLQRERFLLHANNQSNQLQGVKKKYNNLVKPSKGKCRTLTLPKFKALLS